MQNFPINLQGPQGPTRSGPARPGDQPQAKSDFSQALLEGGRSASDRTQQRDSSQPFRGESADASPGGRDREAERPGNQESHGPGHASGQRQLDEGTDDRLSRDDYARLQQILQELGFSEQDVTLVAKLASGESTDLSSNELLQLKTMLQQVQSLLKEKPSAGGEEFSRLMDTLSERLSRLLAQKNGSQAGQAGQVGSEKGETARLSSQQESGTAQNNDRTSASDVAGPEKQAGRSGQPEAASLKDSSQAITRPGQAQPAEKPSVDPQAGRNELFQAQSGQSAPGGKEQHSGGQTGQQGQQKDSEWTGLWQRIRQEGAEGTSGSDHSSRASFQDKADALIQQVMAKSGQNSSNGLSDSESKALRQNVLRQVENGLLKNLGQGKQELTLKLQPPELGSIRVTLQVQGNEVSALLKTSSAEAGRMVQQQMSNLQHLLEQQGLKVQKLDVQTFVQQDGNGQQWLGEHGHNQAQQQRDRMEKRSWLSKWRRMDGQDPDDDVAVPEESSLQRVASRSTISTVA